MIIRFNFEPAPKNQKLKKCHKVTKVHKEQTFRTLSLVGLSVFEPLWQEIDFSEWTQF